jgi:hypothetical protein
MNAHPQVAPSSRDGVMNTTKSCVRKKRFSIEVEWTGAGGVRDWRGAPTGRWIRMWTIKLTKTRTAYLTDSSLKMPHTFWLFFINNLLTIVNIFSSTFFGNVANIFCQHFLEVLAIFFLVNIFGKFANIFSSTFFRSAANIFSQHFFWSLPTFVTKCSNIFREDCSKTFQKCSNIFKKC